ncbi:MAG TPA: beta-ketoacyl-[acyl-carrier-protein] synthase family protein [Flavobacteriaceae bacterium]|nr:beta-ketoacyl-[acyl-carrier-protein] synthase family protein [Flavobacteriaceae bacterium]
MIKRVAITGMGIISSIGSSVEENFNSLITKKHGISCLEILETRHQKTFPSGEIKISNDELASQLNWPKDKVFTRSALLGGIAAKEAIQSAGISDISDAKTGFISATTIGGMDMTEKYYQSFWKNDLSHAYIEAQHAGYSTDKIAEFLGINGFVTTISTACSSAANAIILGARMIQAGKLDRAIVGGADCLSKFTLNGFNTLMILSDEHCRPFDKNRKGLNLGEAAAYLVLESDDLVKQKNKKPLAYLSGFGNANDAFHQTASSSTGKGAFLAMEKALETANFEPEQIDYINAHGTATPNNDLSESVAVKRLFGKIPIFSSTKAFTGHTLAAAASVEAVYSILALQNNLVFPNLNFGNKMEELNMVPQTELIEKELKTVLSNSFGFGGNCSSLIFSKSN